MYMFLMLRKGWIFTDAPELSSQANRHQIGLDIVRTVIIFFIKICIFHTWHLQHLKMNYCYVRRCVVSLLVEHCVRIWRFHYSDVIMSVMASQITSHWHLCGEFTGDPPAQRASNAENVSIWWRHHILLCFVVVIWEVWWQKQVSRTWISNYIPQKTVGCNYLSML